MLKRFFQSDNLQLRYVKIFVLSLLSVNALFSVVILGKMAFNRSYIYPYLGVKVPEDTVFKEVFEAIYKTALEELTSFLVMEFFGIFSILFDNGYLVLMFASAYFMPSIRLSINMAFGTYVQTVLLIFQIFKILCSLVSYYFAYLAFQNKAPKEKVLVDTPNLESGAPKTSSSLANQI